MTTDLPPDVRAEAVRDAKTALRSACGTSISTNAAIQMVDAVVSVAAPEIERPLQARIAELEAALRDAINAAVGYSLGEIDGHDQLVATDTASVVLDGKETTWGEKL